MKHLITVSKSDDGSEYHIVYFDDVDNTIHKVKATYSADAGLKSSKV